MYLKKHVDIAFDRKKNHKQKKLTKVKQQKNHFCNPRHPIFKLFYLEIENFVEFYRII